MADRRDKVVVARHVEDDLGRQIGAVRGLNIEADVHMVTVRVIDDHVAGCHVGDRPRVRLAREPANPVGLGTASNPDHTGLSERRAAVVYRPLVPAPDKSVDAVVVIWYVKAAAATAGHARK